MDHIQPRALGGPDCAHNIQWLCQLHNVRKSHTPPEVWGRNFPGWRTQLALGL